MTAPYKSGGKRTALDYSCGNSASNLPKVTELQRSQKAILTLELRSLSTALPTSINLVCSRVRGIQEVPPARLT